jgi:ankyrin repeat protein
MATQATYIHKPVIPKHPYQDDYINAVIKGDLKGFKDLRVPTRDISRQLFLPDSVRPKLKYTKRGRPVLIRRPTLLQFAVICEQDDIVRYILDYKSPDLSAKAGDGRNVLHVAAAVKDYRPLKILLEYQWVQEHIDEPLSLPGQPPRDGLFNTALHIAVTNQNLRHVFLLISDLPPLHVVPRAAKAAKPDAESEEVAPVERYNPANFDQRSASGHVPLHIAVQQKNLPIVRVLLGAGADPSVQNDDGQTPLGLGKAIKQKYEADLEARRKALETAGKPYTPPDQKYEIDEIVKIIENQPNESLEELRQTLAPDLVPKVEIQGITGGEDDDDRRRLEGGAKLDQLLTFVRRLDQRLTSLESRVSAGVVGGGGGGAAPGAVSGGICSVCQQPGKPCDQCKVPFCAVCTDKAVHGCTK